MDFPFLRFESGIALEANEDTCIGSANVRCKYNKIRLAPAMRANEQGQSTKRLSRVGSGRPGSLSRLLSSAVDLAIAYRTLGRKCNNLKVGARPVVRRFGR
jgi:hypothetical protein